MYSIIPITYSDYNEYVDKMNEIDKSGWILLESIRTYENSPLDGVTTVDWVCKKK